MYRVNGSSISDFEQCRYRWFCKWVLNRVPAVDASVLSGGKLLHLIFEDAGRTGKVLDPTLRLAEWRASLDMTRPAEFAAGLRAVEMIEDLAEVLPLWRDQYEFEIPVLEIEVPFELELSEFPGILWVGRPDRVGVMSGYLWHVQNRGLAAATNFGLYTDLAKRHRHEHLYAEALSRKYPQYPYGGTLFNLVRKLKYRTKITKANPLGEVKRVEEMLFQHPMSIALNSKIHKDVMNSAGYHVREMQRVEQEYKEQGIIPAPNEKMNGGPFGNSRDDYFRVLIGEIDLMDDRYFKDREDMYEVGGGDQA